MPYRMWETDETQAFSGRAPLPYGRMIYTGSKGSVSAVFADGAPSGCTALLYHV